jgi:PhnB protein
MSVNAYLIFNGNCREAAAYYAQVFGTPPPEIMAFGDSPPEPGFEVPEEMKDLVMHTSLNIHGSEVMFSDAMAGSPTVFGTNVNLTVVSEDLEKLTEDFDKLAEEGNVIMPLQKTFWSAAYGVLKDKYGIMWQFNYDDRGLTDEVIE